MGSDLGKCVGLILILVVIRLVISEIRYTARQWSINEVDIIMFVIIGLVILSCSWKVKIGRSTVG